MKFVRTIALLCAVALGLSGCTSRNSSLPENSSVGSPSSQSATPKPTWTKEEWYRAYFTIAANEVQTLDYRFKEGNPLHQKGPGQQRDEAKVASSVVETGLDGLTKGKCPPALSKADTILRQGLRQYDDALKVQTKLWDQTSRTGQVDQRGLDKVAQRRSQALEVISQAKEEYKRVTGLSSP